MCDYDDFYKNKNMKDMYGVVFDYNGDRPYAWFYKTEDEALEAFKNSSNTVVIFPLSFKNRRYECEQVEDTKKEQSLKE